MATESQQQIDATPIALLDVVHPYHQYVSQRRDWVWLADAGFSYSVALVTRKDEALFVRLMKPHRVGIDRSDFQVSISKRMPIANARHPALHYISNWMREMTGEEGKLVLGQPIDVLAKPTGSPNVLTESPVMFAEDRTRTRQVARVVQDAISLDVDRIMRDEGKIRTYGYVLPSPNGVINLSSLL